MKTQYIPEPPVARFLFADVRISPLWLVLRLYVGWEWFSAGWQKVSSPLWTGDQAGAALSGFIGGALHKAGGPHPDVAGWYGWFLHDVVLSHAAIFSYLVAYGEVAVGIALILGLFTGIAAFSGAFMNMNYLMAGTVSVNPMMFLIELLLILAWRTAGWLGVDHWLLPWLGTPWQKGELFQPERFTDSH